MRPETATRRLTKRAHDFLGMSLGQYILEFTHVKTLPNGEKYLWLNDNITMQKTFAVWVNQNDRKEKLIAYHQNDN